eukprot:969699-Pyramimonas_sp.AAC.2
MPHWCCQPTSPCWSGRSAGRGRFRPGRLVGSCWTGSNSKSPRLCPEDCLLVVLLLLWRTSRVQANQFSYWYGQSRHTKM